MKTLLLHLPNEVHTKLKIMAHTKETSMTQLVIQMINGNEAGAIIDEFSNIPPGGEPINTSTTYSAYEIEIAKGILKELHRVRIMTLTELFKILKPQPPSVLNRMIKCCISDGYIKYEDNQFIFVKAP